MSEGENFNYYCDKVIHTMLAETVLLLPWARRRRRVKRLSMSRMYVCMYVYMCVYKKQGRLVFVDWDLPYNTSLRLC